MYVNRGAEPRRLSRDDNWMRAAEALSRQGGSHFYGSTARHVEERACKSGGRETPRPDKPAGTARGPGEA